MSRRLPRLATIAVAAVLLAGAPLALSGCSVVGDIAGDIVEQQTGGDVDLGGNTVPDDFPAEVPLPDGEILFGAAVAGPDGGRVWNVTIKLPGADNPGETLKTQLEGAGFTSSGVGGVTDDGAALNYLQGDLVVVALVGKDGDAWTANYTVTRTQAAN